jgi:hypothetical protein
MNRIIFPLFLSFAAATATPSFAQGNSIQLAPDAPDTYTVKRGDTLWGIAGYFLLEPWRWPEVWRMNKDQIRNPHLIYPGQVILLDRSGPYLSIGQPVGTQSLSPKVYHEPLDSALPSIPVHLIEPFLTRPLVVDSADLGDAATIVAVETQRVFMGQGDTVFAKNIVPGDQNWQIFRPAREIVDYDGKTILGYEAQYLGSAKVTAYGEPGEPATLTILDAVEEVGTGDRLVQSETPQVFAYMPHMPDMEIEGRLISLYRGVMESGRYNVVTLNVGEFDGLEQGHVLALYRDRGTTKYRDEHSGKTETFALPEKNIGLVFVFRVFDRVSYALVMDADGPVSVGDIVRTP